MAFVYVYGLNICTTAATTATAGQIQIDNNDAQQLLLKVTSGNYTYVSISDGVNFEIIRIDSVTPPFINVTRGQGGTTGSAFPAGACIRFQWTAEGIAAVAGSINVALTGAGATQITQTGSSAWTINVPVPTITASEPIEVLGAYPAWELAFTQTSGGCCCNGGSGGGGGSGGITNVVGTGIASASVTSGVATVNVFAPQFVGAGGLQITGTWPNITFTQTSSGGGSGVQSISGSTKILLSGPSSSPTISLATTGIGVGTYNGVSYDSYGTITALDSGYHPVTTVTSTTGALHVLNGGIGQIALSIDPATTTAEGLVQLAATDAASSSNPSDATSAVTPQGLSNVLATRTTATGQNSSNYTPAPLANYTNTVSPTSLALNLTGTQKALITATIIVSDTSITVPPTWGMGVFNGATLLQGTPALMGGSQTIEFLVNANFNATLTLKTTTLAGTSSIVGQSLSAVIFPS